ncbi:MAG: COX15/CtaA family protein [Silvanigrellaceae bacterium]
MRIEVVRRFGWFTLFYMLLVILWGAFVRATGSGAGCGDHRPLCNGVVVPREPRLETIIELTHRVTSGFSLILVVVLWVLSRNAVSKEHPLRRAATWSVVFIVLEALIGAGLVLFELVAHNASMKRMFSMSAHLVNTFALMTSLCLCIWRAEQGQKVRVALMKNVFKVPGIALSGVLLVLSGMTGAIAALGDTLYSGVGSFPLQAYLDGEVPFLLRLRLLHPVVAIFTTIVVLYVQTRHWDVYREKWGAFLGWGLSLLVLLQVGLGFVNVQLMAPIWMQLLHLGVGVTLWLVYSFFSFLVMDKKP